jgi:hypothetical protein
VKKIILVNQTANYLFADIIQAFAKKHSGCEIEAWYGSFDYDTTKLPQRVTLKQGPEYDRSSFGKRFRTWGKFYFWMRRQLRAVDKKDTSFYFVSNPPLFVFLPGISKLDFDCLIYDLYPDVLGDMRKQRLINAIARRWERKNRKVLPQAKHIYTIGEGLKEAITTYLPESMKEKVQIVPVWNKKTESAAKSIRDFKAEWGLTGKKVILYSGNIGLTHPLEYMVELAKRMQSYTDWHFVIVGNGAKKAQLEQQAQGLNNILFKEPVPFEDLSALLAIADWGYVTLDTTATNTSVPSKTYNLLAAGVPILALVNQQSDIAKLIDNYKVGLYYKEQEMDSIINKVTAMNEKDMQTLSANAVQCSTHFTSALADIFADNRLTANV